MMTHLIITTSSTCFKHEGHLLGFSQFFNVLLLILSVSCFLSCSDNNDNEDSRKPSWTLGVNTEQDNPYDLLLFNNKSGNIAMMQLDESGKVDRIDIISNTIKNMMSIMYDEDGLVKSLGIDGMTISFSNYTGNKADIAYIYDNKFFVAQGVEFDINWDEIKKIGESGIHDDTMMNSRVRSYTTAFFSTFEAADAWLREHQDAFKKVFFATDQVIHGKNVFDNTMGMDLTTMDKLGDIGKEMRDATKDFAMFEGDKLLGGNWAWDSFALIQDAKEAFDHFKKANLATIEYDALKMLLTNYEAYSDFCTESWLDIIEFMDSWNKPNTELGEGALTSGMGNLKATLTWGFYADIDLHAYEPSGCHIYWNTKRSDSSDGFLDVDNRKGGPGATENIYWENPEEGEYRFLINYYGSSTFNYAEESGNCKITIMYKGKGNVYNINMTPNSNATLVAVITLPNGTYTRSASTNDLNIRFEKIKKD